MEGRMRSYIEYVNNLYKPMVGYENGFDKEFQEAKLYGSELKINPDCKTSSGQCIENKKKNRYKDILPFDKCRVILDPNTNGTDYINASFIEGSNAGERYIASQGPLPSTVNDFWQMLWQYNVKVIVMVCKEIELGKKKCERYWANDKSEELQFADITVHLHEEQLFDEGYCLRTIKATRGNETKYLQQFHYNSWPDHGVPNTCYEILMLINHIRKVQAHSQDRISPLCVHCSAGCGRTGTVLVVDFIRNLLLNQDISDTLNTLDIVKQMRFQRISIVQTKEQYQFVCNSVSEMFKLFMKNGTVNFSKDDILIEHYVNIEIPSSKSETALHIRKLSVPEVPPPKPSRQRQHGVISKPAVASRPVSMISIPSLSDNHQLRKFNTPFNVLPVGHGPISATPPPKPPINRKPVVQDPQQKSNKIPTAAPRPTELPTMNSDLLPKPRKSPVKPPRSSRKKQVKDENMYSGVQKLSPSNETMHYTNENSLGLKFDGRQHRKYESVKLNPNTYVNDRTRSHSIGTNPAQSSPVPTLPARTPESFVTISDDDCTPVENNCSYEPVDFSPSTQQNYTSQTPQVATNSSTTANSHNPALSGHLFKQKARGMMDMVDKSLSEVSSKISKVGASLAKTNEDDSGGNQPASVRDRIQTFSSEPYTYHGQDISFGNRLNQKVRGSRPMPL